MQTRILIKRFRCWTRKLTGLCRGKALPRLHAPDAGEAGTDSAFSASEGSARGGAASIAEGKCGNEAVVAGGCARGFCGPRPAQTGRAESCLERGGRHAQWWTNSPGTDASRGNGRNYGRRYGQRYCTREPPENLSALFHDATGRQRNWPCKHVPDRTAAHRIYRLHFRSRARNDISH